ncbi:hypothetical protein BKA62DRAFT_706588 [Auriculariales sp. MPI-PUGE-AT-0066]|nr:hypothetical protein BKA62DRAFT_706588 [Auriculariales sp. MPI-PUGE-AT-0066]
MSDPLTLYQDNPARDEHHVSEPRRPSEPYPYPPPDESQEALEPDEHRGLMSNGNGSIKLAGDEEVGLRGMGLRWTTEKAPAFLNSLRDASGSRKRTYILAALAAAVVIVLLLVSTNPHVPKGWNARGYQRCAQDKDFECGFISVPRDYSNPSVAKTEIAVSRFRATDEKRRVGTLWLNGGGPGGSTIHMSFAIAKPLSRLLQGRFDILAHDPRGVSATKPALACFQSIAQGENFRLNTVLGQGFNPPPGDPSLPEHRTIILQQIRDWLALTKAQFEVCLNAPGADDIPFMGTATVARDIDHMTTLVDGKDALINYWGPSYGTVLGAYLVNMFPDRVGRVALDGVVNSWTWSNKPATDWLGTWLNNTERTWEYLMTQCGTVGPKVCPLAKMAVEKADDIIQRVDGWVDGLYASPISYSSNSASTRSGTITSGMVRALIYHTMVGPKYFPGLVDALARAMEGNHTALAALTLPPLTGESSKHSGDVARSIIACLDAPQYDKDKTDTWPTAEQLTDIAIKRLQEVSPRFGMSVSLFEPDGGCQFLAKAGNLQPERFSGPFNKTLKNPILIVNPDLDPLTPLLSARWLNQQLGTSSRLVVQQKTPSHTSFFFGPSLCTAETYRRFFVSGRVPDAKESYCGNELELFEQETSKSRKSSTGPDSVFRATVQELQAALYTYMPPILPV